MERKPLEVRNAVHTESKKVYTSPIPLKSVPVLPGGRMEMLQQPWPSELLETQTRKQTRQAREPQQETKNSAE